MYARNHQVSRQRKSSGPYTQRNKGEVKHSRKSEKPSATAERGGPWLETWSVSEGRYRKTSRRRVVSFLDEVGEITSEQWQFLLKCGPFTGGHFLPGKHPDEIAKNRLSLPALSGNIQTQIKNETTK
jgi:hypothetical protein